MNAEIQIKPVQPADTAVDRFLDTFPLLPRNYQLYRAALAYMFQEGLCAGSKAMADSLIEALEHAATEVEKPS